eukprot:139744-Chlamydomonas_euryale.AAC.3
MGLKGTGLCISKPRASRKAEGLMASSARRGAKSPHPHPTTLPNAGLVWPELPLLTLHCVPSLRSNVWGCRSNPSPPAHWRRATACPPHTLHACSLRSNVWGCR